MKKHLHLFLCAVVAAVLVTAAFVDMGFASEAATPQEVIKLINEAAQLIAEKGEAAFPELNDPKSKWVIKDTYIFAFDCAKGTIVTHPVKPQLIGKNLMGLKDIKGNFFFVQMCEAAKRGNKEWVEYWWPKPDEKNPSRKLSLLISVPGTIFQVGSGVYDEKITVDELNTMSR